MQFFFDQDAVSDELNDLPAASPFPWDRSAFYSRYKGLLKAARLP